MATLRRSILNSHLCSRSLGRRRRRRFGYRGSRPKLALCPPENTFVHNSSFQPGNAFQITLGENSPGRRAASRVHRHTDGKAGGSINLCWLSHSSKRDSFAPLGLNNDSFTSPQSSAICAKAIAAEVARRRRKKRSAEESIAARQRGASFVSHCGRLAGANESLRWSLAAAAGYEAMMRSSCGRLEVAAGSAGGGRVTTAKLGWPIPRAGRAAKRFGDGCA